LSLSEKVFSSVVRTNARIGWASTSVKDFCSKCCADAVGSLVLQYYT
jgi:hypothetical protein